MAKKKTTEEFISEINKLFPNKWDYTKTEYTGAHNKLTVICKVCKYEHNSASAANIKKGSGCPKCAGRAKTNKDYIKEFKTVHGEKYSYHLCKFNTVDDKVQIFCNTCGVTFEQSPYVHRKGSGCPNCYKINKMLTTEQVIDQFNKVHNHTYGYDRVIYKGNDELVEIFCNNCNSYFWQRAKHHKQGQGCACGLIGGYSEEHFIRNPKHKEMPGVLYTLHVTSHNEEFYKKGISRVSVESRANELRRAGYDVEIVNVEYLPLYEAFQKEQDFLKNASKYEPKNKFAGHTECYKLK